MKATITETTLDAAYCMVTLGVAFSYHHGFWSNLLHGLFWPYFVGQGLLRP